MNQTTLHTDPKRRRKWPWVLLVLLVSLPILARVSLKTNLVHHWAKIQAEQYASGMINGTLEIGEMDGDLWKGVTLKGIVMRTPDSDTLFAASEIELRYDLMSYFYPPFTVTRLSVDRPDLRVRERGAGELNLGSILKDQPSEPAGEALPVTVQVISLNNGTVSGHFPSLGGDSLVVAEELAAEAAFSWSGDRYSGELSELRFQLYPGRLPEMNVSSAAQVNARQVTLENLAVGTGRSLVQARGVLNFPDSTESIRLSARPLSWRDISTAFEIYPLKQDLNLDLELEGTPSEFTLNMDAEGEGLDDFRASVRFGREDGLAVKSFGIEAGRMALTTLFTNPDYPDFRNLAISGEGRIGADSLDMAMLSGTLSAEGIRLGRYRMRQVGGRYDLQQGRLRADLRGMRSDEQFNAGLTVNELGESYPRVALHLRGREVNPAFWLDDPAYEGRVNFRADLEGEGFALEERFWDYELEILNSSLGRQQFAGSNVSGRVNATRMTADGSMRLDRSRLQLTAEVDNYQTDASFRYRIKADGLNLAEWRGLEDLPTLINGEVRGEGKFTTPERLRLQSTISVDSSIVNGELIREMNTGITVRDTVLLLDEGRLRSDIADGNFSARLHLLRWYDRSNRLNLNLTLKDIGTFAALADVEELSARGAVTGRVHPVFDDNLQFDGVVELSDLIYGDSFSTDSVKGSVNVLMEEEPEYVLELDLTNPVVNDLELQDIGTMVRGRAVSDSTFGTIQLMLTSPADSRIMHTGSYMVGADRIRLETETLRLVSDLRELTLVRPFELAYDRNGFRMDTLRIQSDDGGMMEAAVLRADSLVQQGYLQGRDLDLTVIQNTLLNESYVDGLLSGRVYLDRRDTVLTATGNVAVSKMLYRGIPLDSLKFNFEIKNDRLETGLGMFDRSDRLVRARFMGPFKLGDPDNFAPDFFEQQVTGNLNVSEVALTRFGELLSGWGVTQTSGLATLNAQLWGTAGNPEMNASFLLKEALLSGVPVDSLRAGFSYDHASRELLANSSVTTLGQQAAAITAVLPAYLDLKNHRAVLPNREDSIRVHVRTNDFRLASLNDFVDRTRIREFNGMVNGDLRIGGALNQLVCNGQLTFEKGAVRFVDAGIKVSEISSLLRFEGETVRIDRFRARSGSGTMTATGSMNFDQLQPGGLDLRVRADNFRILNKPEYRALIDLDSRMTGTVTRPTLKGKLDFVSGFVYLQNFGERSVEAITLDSLTVDPDEPFIPYDSLSMEMDITFNRRFYVRNRRYLDLEYELDGQLDLLKERGEEIRLFGTLGASDGYARPLGKRFTLEEGQIIFRGDPGNPNLSVRHRFDPPQQRLGDVRIWYVIEGTVENPLFKYESEPEMGLEDIISYTLFGKPFMSLDPWKQVVASSGSNTGAADVAMDVLLDKVETLATRRLGIDLVQIDNTRSGKNTGTSIKTGWYLNPRVFFAIQNEITGSTPDTMFTLEYLLNQNLKLIITQGSDSQAGVDLRWNYDY